MPSTRPSTELRGDLTHELSARLDALRSATVAEIAAYEQPINEGRAWPVPPYTAVLTESTEILELAEGEFARVWEVVVPEVPGAITQARNITEAVAMAREVICLLLDTDDWGFELIVEKYPAVPHDPALDA